MKKRYLFAAAFASLAGAALTYKLLSRPRDVEWARFARELHHPQNSWFAMIDGIRVHYQDFGKEDEPPVVMIHGFTASNYIWSDVVKPVASHGFRVVTPDLIGFGFSEKPREFEYTIDAQARTIIRLLDALGIEKAVLVGSSYGGATAATIALDYPERVERLVLVDAVINDYVKDQTLMRLGRAPVIGDLISPLILDSSRIMRRRISQVYHPDNKYLLLDDERFEAHHRPLRSANTHRAVIKSLRHWHANRIEKEAHKITQPTLVVWGDSDRDVPLEHGEFLHRTIPDSRLVVFRNCGHVPQEEYPREFAELIVDFCEEQKGKEMIENVKKQPGDKTKA
jgi:pimeloyl-ACP methyl ester carboxylesterase